VAALNSIEPFLMNVALIDLFYANEECGIGCRRHGAASPGPERAASRTIATVTPTASTKNQVRSAKNHDPGCVS
jgi:hypothetical protein